MYGYYMEEANILVMNCGLLWSRGCEFACVQAQDSSSLCIEDDL